MYSEPKFEIIKLNDEDVVTTSLIDKGDVSTDDIPTFIWPDNAGNP